MKYERLLQDIIPDAKNCRVTKIEKVAVKLPLAKLSLDLLAVAIQQLQQNNYDYVAESGGQKILIKDICEGYSSPIHPQEDLIQALRYCRGMLLIAEYRPNLLFYIMHIWKSYLEKIEFDKEKSIEHTHWLADQFANLLQPEVDGKHARRQVLMARDLATLLEQHPSVVTVSQHDQQLTIEYAESIKINKEYYQRYFDNIVEQQWFKLAMHFAGAKDDNWLQYFFLNHFTDLSDYGVPAPPSARWLPLPANIQMIKNVVVNEGTTKTESQFIRTGVIAAYDIDNEKLQNELALEQLKAIVLQNLESAIVRYKENYADILEDNSDFYVNYLTLLSPHYGEKYLPHKDNNGKFYFQIKQAMLGLANEPKLKALAEKFKINIILGHSNFPINNFANWITTKDAEAGTLLTQKKIQDTLALRDKLLSLTENNKLIPELILRISAAINLNNLLKNSENDQLKTYQRNIMLATLEYLTLGDQALTLAGCKSARDRTSIFAAAVKTMQENPLAMQDWQVLQDGIVKSLQQGQLFRAMQNQVAVIKVNLAHPDFMHALPMELQKQIAKLKIFSKELPAYNKNRFVFFNNASPDASIELRKMGSGVIKP